MDNRFTLKDGIIIALTSLLLVIVVLNMIQVDRQYTKIQGIERKLENLSRSGLSGGGIAPASTDWQKEKLFAPIVEAMQKPDFQMGGTFTDNITTKMGRLTPLISTDIYQTWLECRVMETLTSRDINTLEFIPMLAKSWKISEDGLRFDFKLREGVRFSDGTPFTSDDVIFTFDWIRNEKINAPRIRAYLDKLDKYYANGPYEATFIFKEPYYLSFETIASQAILSKAFYSRFKPEEFNERTGLLFGTGQYRLTDPESWTPGKKIELVRNEYYWGAKGTFDRLEFKEIKDEAAEVVMFGNGEIDRIAVQPKDYEILLKDPNILKMSQHLEYSSVLSGYLYVGWNQQRGGKPTPFADKRVRQAMTYLLDRENICQKIMKGYATVASGPFHPLSGQENPNIKPYPFDVAKGKALLAEAGYKDVNGDGIIEGPDGKTFKFELSYPSGSATYDNTVLVLKDNYAKAGILMDLKPIEFAALLDKLKHSDFDACSLGWGGTIESDPYQIFHSSQIEDEGDNRTHYINKELDATIEKARTTMDQGKRMELWHKVHAILAEDQPYTFLYNNKSLVFINNRIGNVSTSKLGLNYVLLNPMPLPWYVVPGK